MLRPPPTALTRTVRASVVPGRRAGAHPSGGKSDECATAPDDPTHGPLYDLFEEEGEVSSGHSSYGAATHPDVRNRTYATHAFTREAVRRVAAHDAAAAPLFLYLAYSAVHDPKQARLRSARRAPAHPHPLTPAHPHTPDSLDEPAPTYH